MLDLLFQPISDGILEAGAYLLAFAVSLLLGACLAAAASFRGRATGSFALTLLLLPVTVQTVILLVNGSIGTGIAVAGAFSLIRFRSAPGSGREITAVFLAMAAGLASACGYLFIAALLTLAGCAALLAFVYAEGRRAARELRITVPESLNYAHAFDDLFDRYAHSVRLVSVKTTNMGSLFRLRYSLSLKEPDTEKELLDALRCRNGNLEISLGEAAREEEL